MRKPLGGIPENPDKITLGKNLRGGSSPQRTQFFSRGPTPGKTLTWSFLQLEEQNKENTNELWQVTCGA